MTDSTTGVAREAIEFCASWGTRSNVAVLGGTKAVLPLQAASASVDAVGVPPPVRHESAYGRLAGLLLPTAADLSFGSNQVRADVVESFPKPRQVSETVALSTQSIISYLQILQISSR